MATKSDLEYFAVEISYGDTWINLNDKERFEVAAETRENTAKTWRKIVATSPVLGGEYLVHAVPGMVTEQISVRVYGSDQTDLADNFFFVQELFEQFHYRLRWTTNEYREYWKCQISDSTSSRGQVWTHSMMGLCSFQISRFPDVERERIG